MNLCEEFMLVHRMGFDETMETTVKFEYGPLTVEMHSQDDENYQDEVLDLLRFIDNNQEQFDELGMVLETPEMHPDKTETTSLENFSEMGLEEISEDDNTEPSPLDPIADELRISMKELERFLDVNPEEEQLPVIYTDELGDFGKRQTDRQRKTSLVLLYLWHECYGEERVKSSALKDALEYSNVSSSGMANMYQGDGDRYFDRRGRGPTATVSLTPPGKREARKTLRRFARENDD